VPLRFASDKILCAATSIVETISLLHLNLREPPEEGRAVESRVLIEN